MTQKTSRQDLTCVAFSPTINDDYITAVPSPQPGVMQRATATAGRWVGALSAGLALPFSFSAQAGIRDARLDG
ncbi:MAG: hypothetical protein ACHP7D_01435, partial [Lysobacterales bacterium]